MDNRLFFSKLLHLVLQVCTVDRGLPLEVLCLDDAGVERDVKTMVGNLTEVSHIGEATECVRCCCGKEGVACLLVEVVDTQLQAVVEETEVNTKVKLLGLLPLDIRSGNSVELVTY